jgi:hypothetical protein
MMLSANIAKSAIPAVSRGLTLPPVATSRSRRFSSSVANRKLLLAEPFNHR